MKALPSRAACDTVFLSWQRSEDVVRADIFDSGHETGLLHEHEVALPKVGLEDVLKQNRSLRPSVSVGVPAYESAARRIGHPHLVRQDLVERQVVESTLRFAARFETDHDVVAAHPVDDEGVGA